jgi:hypothetical protein
MKKCPICEARRKRQLLEEKIVAWVNANSPVTARDAAKRFRQDYRKMCAYLLQLAKRGRINREPYYNIDPFTDGRRRVRFKAVSAAGAQPAAIHHR